METERITRLGMENGFENSPMARLLREYSGEGGELEASSVPTKTNVDLILGVSELTPHMIVDRGPEGDQRLPRYHLATLHLDRMSTVITELQIFVERAAGIIMERTNYFKIDPGDTLLPLLKGTSSLPQLRAAWLALRHRIELATKAWKKYSVEYQLPPDSKPVLSPISTLPELYLSLQDIAEPDDKLRYLYNQIPHHQEQLTQEGRRSLQDTRSWVNVLPMPDALRNVFSESKAGQPSPTEVRRVSRGKEREHRSAPRPGASSTVWMGMETPFKSANAWFVEHGRSNRSRQPGTSRPPTEPNILLGIATPQAPQTLREWENRERPPHMTGPPRDTEAGPSRDAEADRNSHRGESQASSRADEQRHHTRHRGQRERGNGPDEPPSSDDDDSSFGSRRPRRSRSRRRRSRTPRPQRRRSLTPRPRRHRVAPDDDGMDGSDDGSSDTSYYSSSASTYSRSGRRRRKRSRDSVVIPYGHIAPTIEPKLKQEDLPTWDSNPTTAIEYFWKVQQQAMLGGYIPSALQCLAYCFAQRNSQHNV
jgi:hypothetical protein